MFAGACRVLGGLAPRGSQGAITLHYFHNDGNGHFSDRTAEAGLAGLMGGLISIPATPKGLNLDHFYHVREGHSQAVVVDLKRIHFDLQGGASQSAMPMRMEMPGMP